MWYTERNSDAVQVRTMKQKFSYRLLPLLFAGLGCVGLVLRLALFALEEPSGLLPQNHPLHIAAVLFSFLSAALALYFVLPLKGSGKYRPNFPASRTAALGAVFAGALLLPVSLGIVRQADNRLSIFWAVLCFASAICLILTGMCHSKGRRPHVLLHSTVCLFFAVHMVCQYRLWSGDPQVEDYLFPLFACIFLSLTAYYRVSFDARMGKRRNLLFCGLMAVFFSICSLAGTGNKLFFLAGGLWALTNLCVIAPPKKEKENTDASA